MVRCRKFMAHVNVSDLGPESAAARERVRPGGNTLIILISLLSYKYFTNNIITLIGGGHESSDNQARQRLLMTLITLITLMTAITLITLITLRRQEIHFGPGSGRELGPLLHQQAVLITRMTLMTLITLITLINPNNPNTTNNPNGTNNLHNLNNPDNPNRLLLYWSQDGQTRHARVLCVDTPLDPPDPPMGSYGPSMDRLWISFCSC